MPLLPAFLYSDLATVEGRPRVAARNRGRNRWRQRPERAPSRRHQGRVAQLLGVSVAESVSGGTNLTQRFATHAEVALVSEVKARKFNVIDNFEPSGEFETVPVTVPIKRRTYALRVNGDSMASETGDTFPHASIIIVEPAIESRARRLRDRFEQRQRDHTQAIGQGRR